MSANTSIDNSTTTVLRYEQHLLYMMTEVMLLAVLSISGIFGNILTITVIFKTATLHSVPNCFIANLAAADFIVCFLLEPAYYVETVTTLSLIHI